MISARLAATISPMSAASRLPRGFRRSICRFIAHSCSRWFARWSAAPVADWMQQLHPLRLQYELFSDQNPFMAPVARLAEQVRANRKPSTTTIPFSRRRKTCQSRSWRRSMPGAMQARHWPSGCSWRSMARRRFRLRSASTRPGRNRLRKAAKNPLHRELLQKRIAELKSRIPVGGLREAVVRSLIYVGHESRRSRRARL